MVLNEYGIRISMDGQGGSLDSLIIESQWRSVKYDEVYLNPYASLWAAEAGLNRYLKHYNESRWDQAPWPTPRRRPAATS